MKTKDTTEKIIEKYGKEWGIKPHVLKGKLWWKDAIYESLTLQKSQYEKTHRRINPDCEKHKIELHTYFSEDFQGSNEGTSGWYCPVCDRERKIKEKNDKLKEGDKE